MKTSPITAIAAAFASLPIAAIAHLDHEKCDPLSPIAKAETLPTTPLAVEVPDGLPDAMTIKVARGSRLEKFELKKYNCRSENFRVLETDGSGGLREIEAPPVCTYRGEIAGDPGSQVVGIVMGKGFSGEILCGDGKCWKIEAPSKGSETHRWRSLSNSEVLSKLEGLDASDKNPLSLGLALALPRAVTVKRAEIGFDIDYPTWSRSNSGGFNGSDTAAVAKMEEFVAVKLNSFLISNILVEHVVGTIVIRKSQAEDPYDGMTDGNAALSRHRDVWNGSGNTGFARPSTTHHLATVLIGRGQVGNGRGIVGLGYVGTINETSRYTLAVTTSGSGVGFWFNGVCKHEVAHNWNLSHGGCTDERRPGAADLFSWSMCGAFHDKARSEEAARALSERDSSNLPDIGAYTAADIAPYCPKDLFNATIGGAATQLDVLRNDYDANNSPFQIQRLAQVDGEANSATEQGGTMSVADGTGPGGRDEITYTPPTSGSPGDVDIFYYLARDDTGKGQWGQVKVTLQPSTLPKEVNPANYIADTALDFSNQTNPVMREIGEGLLEPEWSYGSFVGGSTTLSLATGSQLDGANVIGAENVGWIGSGAVRIHKYATLSSATNGEPAVKRWHSDYDGKVAVHYDAKRLNSDGNGLRVSIRLNGAEQWGDTLDNSDPHATGTVLFEIAKGDTVDFVNDGLGDRTGDWTHFTGRIIRAEQFDEDAASDLALHFKLDAAGTFPPERKKIAADYSGGKNHAALSGFDTNATRAAAEVENGLLFDGADSELVTGQIGSLQGATKMTISAWVNPQSLGDNRGAITSLNDTDGNASYFGILIGAGSDGHPAQFRAHRAGINAPSGSLPVGRWTHVCGVWESGQTQKLYLDGVEVANNTNPPSGGFDSDHWVVGRDRDQTGRWWQGGMDDIAVFERAMDASEVAALYAASRDVKSYDGNGQHDRIDSPRYADGSYEATLSAWVRAGSLAEHRGILTTWTEEDFPGDSFERSYFALSIGDSDDGLPAQFRAHRWITQGLPGSFPVGQWVHVAGVWKAGVEQSMYIDGVKVAENPNPSSSQIDIGGWVIARNELSDNRYFDGEIGETLVLARALDATEIGELYATGRTNFPATEGPFTHTGQIGAQTGTYVEASGIHTTSTRGDRISGTTDSFHFASRPYAGDGEITVKLEALSDTGNGAKLGLMARQDRTPGSPFLIFYQYGDGRLALRSRFDQNGTHTTEKTITHPEAYPIWLRLARDDDHFYATYSEDGVEWQYFDDLEFDLPLEVDFGIAHQSASTGVRSIASFSDFTFSSEITTQPDSDSDGLLDSWETENFGNLSQGANDDPDGDGTSNLLERFHGTDPATGDAPAVSTAITSITGNLIPENSAWLYLDDGSDQGSAWRAPGFDDSAWASGPAPLGYGEGDIATSVDFGGGADNRHITTYFRHHFEVGDPSLLSGHQLFVRRDDGIAVYLNGVELGRDNLAPGAGYDVLADLSLSGTAESTPVSIPIAPGDLVPGSNVLAAELHQATPGSSDLAFALELTADLPPGTSEGTFLVHRFPRSKSATDLVITGETSTDLINWTGTAPARVIEDLGATEILEVQVPYTPGTTHQFLRGRVAET